MPKSYANSTDIVDAFYGHVLQKAKKINFNTLIKPLIAFTDKNHEILLTNIIGDQLLFNESMENVIFDALDLKLKDVRKIIDENQYYKDNIGDFALKHQFTIAIPYLLLAKAYTELRKEKQARLMYMFIYYKPYSSLIFKYFNNNTGVNKDRMRFTIENLSNKYALKTLGSIQAVIQSTSDTSYDNYVKKNPLLISATDKGLHEIFTSGVYSRLNQTIKNIKSEYEKNEGKYLRYEEEVRDVESGNYHITGSVSLNKSNIARKAEKNMVNRPIDENILDLIVGKRKTKSGRLANIYGIDINRKALKITLERIREEKYKEFFEFFDAILTVFFMEKKNVKNEDIKTPVFIKSALDIYQMSNSKSESIDTIKTLTKSWLTDCSSYYITRKNTQKSGMQKAVYLYFITILQRS